MQSWTILGWVLKMLYRKTKIKKTKENICETEKKNVQLGLRHSTILTRCCHLLVTYASNICSFKFFHQNVGKKNLQLVASSSHRLPSFPFLFICRCFDTREILRSFSCYSRPWCTYQVFRNMPWGLTAWIWTAAFPSALDPRAPPSFCEVAGTVHGRRSEATARRWSLVHVSKEVGDFSIADVFFLGQKALWTETFHQSSSLQVGVLR